MKSFGNTSTLLITILGFVLVTRTIRIRNFFSGQQTVDLKTPDRNQVFGDGNKGSVLIVPKRHVVNIIANMTSRPKEGKVFEDWLADVGGCDYKLCLGEFSKNGTLDYTGNMVNPYTYTQFLVTEVPFEDSDPNGASAITGA